jgi:hypothetical protein
MSNELMVRQQGAFAALQSQYAGRDCHLLLPKTSMTNIPAGTTLSVREITIDVDNETYPLRGGGNKVGLTKVALDKIAAAAGVTWISVERIDDRRQIGYYEYRVRARVFDLDGTPREALGTKAVDLRPDADGKGSPGKDADGMSQAQIAQARRYGPEMCESKAKNRAIANLLAIPRSYTKAELAKPFVVPRLSPDTSDPIARQMVLGMMLGAAGQLYGGLAHESNMQAPVEVTTEIEPTPEPKPVPELPPAPKPAPAMDLRDRLREAWGWAQSLGLGVQEWHDLVAKTGAPAKAEEMTHDNVLRIEEAIAKISCGDA